MAVGAGGIAKPPRPALVVTQDPIAVNLQRGRNAAGDWRQGGDQVHPPSEYRSRGFLRGEVEAPCLTSCGEGGDADVPEAGRFFVRREGHERVYRQAGA